MKVAVVGGGLGGLVGAWRLVQAGHEVTVFEPGQIGGVIATPVVRGARCETAASAFRASAGGGAVALCDELGVELLAASANARKRWIYIDGKLQALPTGPLSFARSELMTWRGKLGLLREPFMPARASTASGDESVHAFALRRIGPEATRALVGPMVTGVFAADANEVSLEAGFPRLAALDADGGVVRGLVRQAVRGLGGPGRGARRRGLYAPRAGMQALVAALAQKLGARIRARAVTAIHPDADGVEVGLGGETERVQAVVLATPAVAAAELVQAAWRELAEELRGLRRAPAVVAQVFLDHRAQVGRDGFGALVAAGEVPRALGIVFESTLWPERAPPGLASLRCLYGGARDPSILALDDTALARQINDDLARVLGVRAPVDIGHITRWPAALAQYPVGHRARVGSMARRARARRLVLAGADYFGLAINELCDDGARVVEEIAGMGRGEV